MSIEFKKVEAASGRFPEIWRGECKVLPAGFKPVQTFQNGTLLRRGTLLSVDFENRTAAVVKIGTVLSGSTTKAVRVAKWLGFAIGDTVTKFAEGTANAKVESIDTKNISYDVLNLSAAVTGLAAGDTLVETVASGADAETKARFTPNMILAADIVFDGKGIPTLDAAYEAVVLTPSMGFKVPDAWLVGGTCLATNPNILFITQ